MIKLYNGDCFEIMRMLIKAGVKVDAVIADPPYGTTRCKWDSVLELGEMWQLLGEITKPTTPICLFGAEPFSSLLRVSNIKQFKYDWVWDKNQGTGHFNAKKQPLRCHEIVSVFYEKQCYYNPVMTQGHVRKTAFKRKTLLSDVYNANVRDTYYDSTERYPRSIQAFSKDTQKTSLHPTQKPLALMEYLVRTYTRQDDLVLDFCMGSGTTVLACKNLQRRAIGIELEESFFNIAQKRLKDA